MATQDECRKAFLANAKAFLEAINRVNDETPADELSPDISPNWWVDMMYLADHARSVVKNHEKDSDYHGNLQNQPAHTRPAS